ncbi:TPA: hypothetical protein MO340_004199 [Salmonella enterica subsp. salamae serovar 35:g,m,s,t:-]|nr:hypothetical protein [Salmonella enterica subsp. salamae serovar 35:g,m,s,t:-]HCA3549671.1 hypothetical protein [Salmonella enterica subsp. salamae serovar 35:g,m,s,t:-]
MTNKLNMVINIEPKKFKMMGLVFSASLFIGSWGLLIAAYFFLTREFAHYSITNINGELGLEISELDVYAMMGFCLSGTLLGKIIYRARKSIWKPLQYLYNASPLILIAWIVLFVFAREALIKIDYKKHEDEVSQFNAKISKDQYARANEGKAEAILWVVAQNPSQAWRLKPLIDKGNSEAMLLEYYSSKDIRESQKLLHEAANQGNAIALRLLDYQARGKENDQKIK